MLVRLTCTCIAAMGDLAIEYGGDTRAKGFGMRRGRGARGDGDGREEGRTDGRSVVFVVFVIHVNDARAAITPRTRRRSLWWSEGRR